MGGKPGEGLDDLTFLGICAISDPLRPEVPQAVADCRRAGIEVKVLTGDTSATAAEIASQAGIMTDDEDDYDDISRSCLTGAAFSDMDSQEALDVVEDLCVMSRARPADKQRLVRLLQDRDEVVAVTGDGTNDAPALNHAHVGLSLGSGTSVAKQASDITLLDDSFLSIVKAVMWGRSLYRNIQRFIFFQLVVNVAALLLVLAGSVMGTELPLTVTQILWVNLIMDTFAAMALASLPPSREVMDEQPRRASDFIITRHMGQAIAFTGVAFAVLMTLYLYYIEHSGAGISVEELTQFFTTFVMLQWWNLLNARALGSCHSAFRYLLRCRGMLLVMAMILVGQWLIVTFGGEMFRTQPLSAHTWMVIIAATSPVFIVGEAIRAFRRYKRAAN
jgi:Ca2+-transporting ATPase